MSLSFVKSTAPFMALAFIQKPNVPKLSRYLLLSCLLYGTEKAVKKRGATALAGAALSCALATPPPSAAFYLLLRKLARRASSLLLHPLSIYAIHCAHNHLVTHRAELLSPAYLRMWLGVYPGYDDLAAFMACHSTKASSSERYPEGILSLADVVPVARQMFASQLKILIVLMGAQRLLAGKTIHAASTLLAAARSAAVLTSLPLILFKFPAVWSRLTKSTNRAHPAVEACVVSAATAAAFLAERKNAGRLETITAYTYFRVLECFVCTAAATTTTLLGPACVGASLIM